MARTRGRNSWSCRRGLVAALTSRGVEWSTVRERWCVGVLTGCGGQPPPPAVGGHSRPSAGHLIGSAWHARSRRPPRQTERRDRCSAGHAPSGSPPRRFPSFPGARALPRFPADRWPPLIDWPVHLPNVLGQHRRSSLLCPGGPWDGTCLWPRAGLRGYFNENLFDYLQCSHSFHII